MSNEIYVLNRDTIRAGIKRVLGLAAVIGVTALGIRGCNYLQEVSKTAVRTALVKKAITEGNFDIATNMLASYSMSNLLSNTDITKLNFEVVSRQNELKAEKKKQLVSSLETLITQGKQAEANNTYNQIVNESLIPTNAPNLVQYRERIDSLSPENALKKITSLCGEEKIGAFENFCSSYPTNSQVPQLRLEQANEYISMANLYFDSRVEQEKICEHLDRFIAWSKNQNTNIISRVKVDSLSEKGKKYISVSPKSPESPDLHIGDRVIVVKKLGIARGDVNSFLYSEGNGIPLGTKGMITGKDVGRNRNEGVLLDTFRVWIEKENADFIFAYNELRKENSFTPSEILNRLTAIQAIYGVSR
jgi:hypothetical protein